MHHGATGNLFANARELRRHPTPAEEKLWQQLRNNQMGYKYRRQHPMMKYVVDFFCFELRLAIEVDGPIHEQPLNKLEDEQKQKDLESDGITVIRFTNQEVLEHTDEVLKQIHLMQEMLANRREL